MTNLVETFKAMIQPFFTLIGTASPYWQMPIFIAILLTPLVYLFQLGGRRK